MVWLGSPLPQLGVPQISKVLLSPTPARLRQKVAEMEGAEESLDHQLYGAVREQAEKKGLSYPASAPAY